MALLLLIVCVLTALPQVQASAWGSSAERTQAEGSRLIPLPDGELLLLRDQGGGRFALERRSQDLRVRWRTFFELPELRPRWEPEGWLQSAPLFDLDPAGMLADDSSRAIGLTENSLRLFQAGEGRVIALEVALEDGAQQRQVLWESATPVALEVMSEGGFAAIVVRGGGEDEVLLFDDALSLSTSWPIAPGERISLHEGGRVCGVADQERSLALRCGTPGTPERLGTRIPKGDLRLRGARVVSDGPHHAYLIASLDGEEESPDQILVARLHAGAPEPVVVTWVGLPRLMKGLGGNDPRWLVLRDAVVPPEGGLVLHGQFVVPRVVRAGNPSFNNASSFETWNLATRASIAFEYREIVAFGFDDLGGLRWSAELPLFHVTDADSVGDAARLVESAGYSAALVEGALRVQYAEHGVVDLVSGARGRRVISREISLADGAVAEPVEVLRLAAEEQYLRALSQPLGPEAWLVCVRLRPSVALPDTTLMVRVDPEPMALLPAQAQAGASRSSERYRTGRLLGFHDGLVSGGWRPPVAGLSAGGGASALAMTGAWIALGTTPPGCCLASAAGCAGCAVGVGAARVLGGGPAWMPDGELDFREGYRAGYRQAMRSQQARWAAVGGVSMVGMAAVVASSGIMFPLMGWPDGPPR